MTKSSKTPPDSVKQRKAKGTIKRPKDQKTAKRRASQAQARKAMKMMKSLKGPKAKQAPKQQMKSSRGRKDTKPAKAMKAIVKAMKSMSVMKVPVAKPVAKPAASKPVAKNAVAKHAASPKPGPGRSAAATIARRLRAQAKSALQLPSVAKTKLCTFWLEGKCRRGEQCEFAHGAAEQLENCRKVPCRFHLGSVFPPSCKFAHSAADSADMPPQLSEEAIGELAVDVCGIFDSISQSRAPEEVSFAQSSDALDDLASETVADEFGFRPQKTLMCKFWLRGKCQRLLGCAFAHGEEEQRVACKRLRCRFDKEGFCKQGSTCWYAHGEAASGLLAEDAGSLQLLGPGLVVPLPSAPSSAPPPPGLEPMDAPSSTASMRTSEDDPTKPQKTLLCRYWLKGRCLRLRDCAFAHGAVEQQAACAQIRCRFEREGYCKLGDACWYAHEGRLSSAPYAEGPGLQAPPGLELPPSSLLDSPPGLG